MTPLKPFRAALACMFVLTSLTACESGKTGEQAAQSDRPPTHAAPITESPALPATPPPAPSGPSDQEATAHPNKATEPTPDAAPIEPAPTPAAKVPDTTRPTVTTNTAVPVPLVVVPVESVKSDEDFDEESPAEGGTLTGKVTFKGVPPAPKTFAFNKFPNPGFCSKIDSDGNGNRVVQEVKVGKDNALKDVVVYVEGVQGGKPFNFEGTKVTADGCRFLVQDGPSTFAGVVVKKKEIAIENMDADPNDPKAVTGVLHNPHAYEVTGASNTTIFNLPLAEKGQVIKKPVVLRKKESILKLECDQHNFMQAFFVLVENPYYAIVGDDGTFRIADIPPGTYEVYAWHPTLGKQEAIVTIPAKGHTKADFSFAAK